MKVPTKMVRSRASASTHGPTVHFTLVTGTTTKLTALVNICGKMAVNTMANGKRMTCQDTAFTSTTTVSHMKVNSLMTRRQGTVTISGLMDDSMRAGGTAASSTALAFSKTRRKVRRSTASGNKASDCNGSTSRPSTKSTSSDTTTRSSSKRRRALTA